MFKVPLFKKLIKNHDTAEKSPKNAVIIQAHENFPDFRSLRQVNILINENFDVHSIVWNRSGNKKYINQDIKCNVHPIQLKCDHGLRAAQLFLLLPLFWLRVTYTLFLIKPSVIIANNLDTAVPSVIFSFFSRTKVIFDSREPYHAVFQEKTKSKIFEWLGWKLDQIVAKNSTFVIAVTPNMIKMYEQMNVKAHFIPNAPTRDFFQKTKNHKASTNLTIAFIGNLRANTGITKIADVVANFNKSSDFKIKLLLVGLCLSNFREDLLNIKKQLNRQLIHLDFINPSDVPALYQSVDLTFQLPEINRKYKRYGLNVKIYESLASGVPVISNFDGENYNFLQDGNGVSWVKSKKDLIKAIDKLKEPKIRNKFGAAGQQFIENNNYFWDYYETLYRRLISEKLI